MNKKSSVILLTILLISSEIINPEIFYIIIFTLDIVLLLKNGIYKKVCRVIYPLLIIFLIGIFIGYINLGIGSYEIRDYIRDIFYFSAPFIFIIYGAMIYNNKNSNILVLYKSIIYAAIIISIRHCILIIMNFNKIFTGLGSRGIGGLQSSVTVIGIVLILFLPYEELVKLINNRKKIFLTKILLIISFTLYLSRTDFIVLLGFILIFFLTQKNINLLKIFKAIFKVAVILIIAIQCIPNNMKEEFMLKSTKIFTEISSNDKDGWDFERINNDWRGYEINQTKITFSNGNLFEKIFGFGFGKNVNIDSRIYLGGKEYTNLPILHNGYYYVLLKCGLIGVSILIFFIINLLIKYIKKILMNKIDFEYKLLVGSGIWMLLSTYVVTGIFNISISFVYMIIIGYLSMLCNEKNKNSGIKD